MEAHFEGDFIRRKRQDELAFYQGYYNFEAMSTAIGNAFRKKGQKPHPYREKPILHDARNKPLSEKEKAKQTELFFAKLRTMKANFELSKGDSDENIKAERREVV